MTSIWVIESSRNGHYWSYYSTEEDISSKDEMLERLKQIVSHDRVFRGVEYIRDESTGVDRPFLATDFHSTGRDCSSWGAEHGRHCQHYHQGGKCCDCGEQAVHAGLTA